MARKSKIEQLNVVADPWNLKLKPAAPSDTRFTCYTFTHFASRLFWVKMKTSLKPRRQILIIGDILQKMTDSKRQLKNKLFLYFSTALLISQSR